MCGAIAHMHALHSAVASQLLSKIKSGEATASEYAAAIKFLKDNGIEALKVKGSPMDSLANEFELPEFDVDGNVVPMVSRSS